MAVLGSLDGEGRRARLRARLESEGAVDVARAAAEQGVSEMTIRRDLAEMERSGLARRVRGGAVVLAPQLFQRRQRTAAAAKAVIAAKLVPLFPRTGAVAMDASSTVHRLAVGIDTADVTVVTSGVETFGVLSARPDIRSVLTGGELELSTGALVGPIAQRSIRDFVFARAFVSPTGLHPELGATEATADGAEITRAFRLAARSVVLAVDSTKFDQAAPARALGLDEVDLLVTELDPADERLDPYRGRVELL